MKLNKNVTGMFILMVAKEIFQEVSKTNADGNTKCILYTNESLIDGIVRPRRFVICNIEGCESIKFMISNHKSSTIVEVSITPREIFLRRYILTRRNKRDTKEYLMVPTTEWNITYSETSGDIITKATDKIYEMLLDK